MPGNSRDIPRGVLLLGLVFMGSATAVGRAVTDARQARCPANIDAPPFVERLLATMWERSPTFRRQCVRLAENPGVAVEINLANNVTRGTARSVVEANEGGVRAAVSIDVHRPDLMVENLAHEIEHVLEYLDGIDLPLLAKRGLRGVANLGEDYETARAKAVGKSVAREVATLVARQGIRADAVNELRPSSFDERGRLIAFAARTREAPQGHGTRQVYVLDRSTGAITRESAAPDGTPANGDSQAPSLDAAGEVIAFETVATNLVASNLVAEPSSVPRLRVVVRDRHHGLLLTPKSASGSEELDGSSHEPAISGDGRTVVFTSSAANLVAGADANGRRSDVYLWRLEESSISRVSVDSRGTQSPAGASHTPSVSRDGGLVAFVSTARLAPEDTNDVADVYLRDVRRGVTSLVSRGLHGRAGDGASHSPSLSGDGRFIVFASKAANLVARDRNGERDVFLCEVKTGAITLVSATAKGDAADADSGHPAISADGRIVVYQSVASNLGAGSGSGCPRLTPDSNLLPDIYLVDRGQSCVTRVSGSPGADWWTPSAVPAIDAAGTFVVFSSRQPTDDEDLSTDFDLFLALLPRGPGKLSGF